MRARIYTNRVSAFYQLAKRHNTYNRGNLRKVTQRQHKYDGYDFVKLSCDFKKKYQDFAISQIV